MEPIKLTTAQARLFLLERHGLLGKQRYAGKQGIVDFVRRSGCIQFDPIDMCGKNAELTLFSRVKGFTKQSLGDVLYGEEPALLDYFDKNLAIMPCEDWPYFARTRLWHVEHARNLERLREAEPVVRKALENRDFVFAKDLTELSERMEWDWSATSTVARAALEWMYFKGALMVHHKEKGNKAYTLAERRVPESLLNAPDPNKTDADYRTWLTHRRIRAVGLLPCGPSDAWLCIPDFQQENRQLAFDILLGEEKIVPVLIEDKRKPLYACADELPLLQSAAEGRLKSTNRMEFMAPLDVMLWDRRVIEALFGFHYSWEIYYPAEKRKFGYYVLPVLYGDRLVARIEPVCERKTGTLVVKNLWLEEGFRGGKGFDTAIQKTLERLARFNGMTSIRWEEKA